MNIPSYVYQNGFGIYYFRIAIPKHLKAAIGKHEIRKSLKTTNYHYALRQARTFAVITEHLFLAGICDINEINSALKKSRAHPISYNGSFVHGICLDTLPMINQAVPGQPEAIASPKLSSLIDQYISCQEVENNWQEKTKEENKAIFDPHCRYRQYQTIGDRPSNSGHISINPQAVATAHEQISNLSQEDNKTNSCIAS